MLSTHPPPEQIIIRQLSPPSADLSCFSQGDGIQEPQDFQRHFFRKKREWVDADDLGEGFGEVRELREATHGENAFEDDFSFGMWGGGKGGPEGGDGGSFGHWKGVEGLDEGRRERGRSQQDRGPNEREAEAAKNNTFSLLLAYMRTCVVTTQ